MPPKKRKPKEPIVAKGKGWFELVKTKDGLELRLRLQEYTAAKLEKEEE